MASFSERNPPTPRVIDSGGGVVAYWQPSVLGAIFHERAMSAKTKVLQLMGWGHYTSQAGLLQQITQSLPKSRYEVTHAYLRGETEGDGVVPLANDVKYFRFSRRQRSGLRFHAIAELEEFCKQRQYDVVIGHTFRAVSMLLSVNKRLGFRLCIGVVHSVSRYDSLRRQMRIKFLIRDNCRFVGVSDEVTDYLLSLRAGFTPANTCTINNAVDIDGIRQHSLGQREARKALGLPEDGFLFGALGRFAPVKDHRTLLKAFALMSDKCPHACLAIIGEGELEPEYQRLIAKAGLEQRVFLLGKVPHANRYLKAYDVYIQPSISESLSVALMEAMASSLPIIASDAPGNELVVSSVGQTFPRGDKHALAAAMQEFIALDEGALDSIGTRTCQYLQDNHSSEAYRREFLRLVESCQDS